MLKNGSLTGYFLLPHKDTCSKICGTPLELSERVQNMIPMALFISSLSK